MAINSEVHKNFSIEMIGMETSKLKTSVNAEREKTKPLPMSKVWNSFSDYSQRSTIHGIRYLGEKERHWTERLLWLMVFTISIVLSGKLITEMYWRRLNAPVIISFAAETKKVADIPFPTVTICVDGPAVDIRKLRYSRYYDIFNVNRNEFNETSFALENVSDADNLLLHALTTKTNVCESPKIYYDEYWSDDVVMAYSKVKNFYVLAEKALLDIFDHSLAECTLGNTDMDGIGCNHFFKKTFTDGGFCYSFNYLESKKMFKANIADTFRMLDPFRIDYKEARNITYPFRVQNSAENFKIHLFIPRNYQDVMCGKINGLKVHIHSGDDMARFKKSFYYIPLNQHVRLIVRPDIIETDDSLIRNYDKNQRKCVAEHENDLIFFKKYTQSNCQVDKYVDDWIKNPSIQCATQWMPHFNRTKICLASKTHLHERFDDNNNFTDKCLPACNSISYDVQLFNENVNSANSYDIVFDRIKIDIAFNAEQYFPLRRSELNSFNDFISNCGGILSLFMGVSMLSIVEILYSSTHRAFCNWRNRKSLIDREPIDDDARVEEIVCRN